MRSRQRFRKRKMAFSDSHSGAEAAREYLQQPQNKRAYQVVRRLAESCPWTALLIYAGLYVRNLGSTDERLFFARKTLELVEEECRQGVGVVAVGSNGEGQSASEGEAWQFLRKWRDQFLIAVAFVVLAFDNPDLRTSIRQMEKEIAKEIGQIERRFVDQVPLNDYLVILKRRFRESELSLRPLDVMFDEMFRDADSVAFSRYEQRVVKLGICVDLLIQQVGRNMEKPDRAFSYADSLAILSQYAEAVFDSQGKGQEQFFNRYRWAYPRGLPFNDLNEFWAACMTGLFAFRRALDRSVALVGAGQQDKAKPTIADAQGERESTI